jgi:hypothetical protein
MHRHLHTGTEYAILTAFPLQQLLHKRASLLRYTYIACLVYFYYGKNKREELALTHCPTVFTPIMIEKAKILFRPMLRSLCSFFLLVGAARKR